LLFSFKWSSWIPAFLNGLTLLDYFLFVRRFLPNFARMSRKTPTSTEKDEALSPWLLHAEAVDITLSFWHIALSICLHESC
jgi:hypothetical protein